MRILKLFGFTSRSEKIERALEKGAIIVDVRTPQEFKHGHIKGALNIPLDRISSQAGKLAAKNKVIITTCRSGARSASAAAMLRSAGMDAINGGAWTSLRSIIQPNTRKAS